MKWIDVLILSIYTLWLIIAWKVFWRVIGDKADKEKIIIFYMFTLMTALINLLLAMCMALLHL